MTSEAAARQILARHGRAAVLVSIVEGAVKAHFAEQRARSARARAAVIWDYMADAADLEFAPIQGVDRVEVQGGLPFYVCDSTIAVRFKKLTRELLTRNHTSGQQREIQAQRTLDGLPPLTYISVGYVLDKAEADVERVAAVKHVRLRREWYIDLRELAAGQLAPVAPVLDLTPAAGTGQLDLPTVKPQPIAEHDEQ